MHFSSINNFTLSLQVKRIQRQLLYFLFYAFRWFIEKYQWIKTDNFTVSNNENYQWKLSIIFTVYVKWRHFLDEMTSFSQRNSLVILFNNVYKLWKKHKIKRKFVGFGGLSILIHSWSYKIYIFTRGCATRENIIFYDHSWIKIDNPPDPTNILYVIFFISKWLHDELHNRYIQNLFHRDSA